MAEKPPEFNQYQSLNQRKFNYESKLDLLNAVELPGVAVMSEEVFKKFYPEEIYDRLFPNLRSRGESEVEESKFFSKFVSGVITSIAKQFGREKENNPLALDLSQIKNEKYFNNAARVAAILPFEEQALFLAVSYLPKKIDAELKMTVNLKLMSQDPTLIPDTRLVVYETAKTNEKSSVKILESIGQSRPDLDTNRLLDEVVVGSSVNFMKVPFDADLIVKTKNSVEIEPFHLVIISGLDKIDQTESIAAIIDSSLIIDAIRSFAQEDWGITLIR